MILKETILSAFTERGTLLKWLKKVEAALNTAVLTDISVVQVSETQIKLKFTFENGDFVESPVLTLPRGEKGKDGLDGQGIAATIEVGTVITGAAGTNASVTNVGTEQRAILNFVIPRGANGTDGSAGVGFDDAEFISINDGAISITAGNNGVDIGAVLEVAVGEEVLEIPSTMYLPLKGSESIVIDVDESGDFIDIHLDADIAAKLGRVLVTPMSAPATISLVAVDTTNAQTMLTLGDGLSVSGGVLSATGGGGSAQRGYRITAGTRVQFTSVILADGSRISNPIETVYDNVAFFTCSVTPATTPCYLTLPVAIYRTYISNNWGELKATFGTIETLTPNGAVVTYNVLPFADGTISVTIGGGGAD